MIESMTIHVLQVVFMAITQAGRLGTGGQEVDAYSTVEGWLTGFAMAALIISLILVFFLSANHRRSLNSFRHKIDGLKTEITELKHEIAELRQYAPDVESEHAPSRESEEPVAILEN
jgi:hypothetical protein